MAAPEPSSPAPDLPLLDEHRIAIGAPRDRVWAGLCRWSDTLGVGDRHPLGLLLGTQPRRGFERVELVPERVLGFAGRHRFSRYRLTFELAEITPLRTQVTARSNAEFPRLRGRAYHALVVGSGAHVVSVRRMLNSIRRESLKD
ncbi:hypothetical protein GCM10009853_032530 [Glycomyces scopariae]